MKKSIWRCRKETMPLHAMLRTKLSIYISYVLIKLGVKAEQVCVGWGIIHVANSYLLYKVIAGYWNLIPIYFLIQIFADILDVVDGEIARYRNSINPISGKLLDGIGHRMTEYSMLIAFSYGVFEKTSFTYCLFIGFVAIFGEAMFTYCSERKITVMRLYAKEHIHKEFTARIKRYPVNMKWAEYTLAEKIQCIKGLFIYRSTYFIIFWAYISNLFLIIAFIFLALYKNYAWIRLAWDLCMNPPELKEGSLDQAAYWKQKSNVDIVEGIEK